MSIDGRFIKHLSMELHQELEGGRIQKVSQISYSDFLFSIRANKINHQLYLSLSTSAPRMYLIDQTLNHFENPGGFGMFLRKHVEGGQIIKISTINNDRIIKITYQNINDLGDEVIYHLFFESFGRYTNLIITDQFDVILNAYKHIHPFEQIDRIVINGAKYLPPKDEKIDPEDFSNVQNFFNRELIGVKDVIENIRGISPLFAKTLLRHASYQSSKMFLVYQTLISKPVKPTLFLDQGQFYYTDIFEGQKQYFNSLSELMSFYYKQYTDKEKVKQIHKYLNGFIKTQINKLKNKIENLNKDLDQANQFDEYRIKGDLLFQDQHKIDPTSNQHIGFSYELNKTVTVELDRSLSIIDNAQIYYKKYKKLKQAIKHIHLQQNIAKQELLYFNGLFLQIEHQYDIQDLEEIKDELIQQKYLPQKKMKPKSKQMKLNYNIYQYQDQATFYVGKNNLQNNYLTHHFAKKTDLWFHVQKQSGSHVIVKSDRVSEEIIRHAANLAAYFSRSQSSGSVPIDYTLVKNIKKIPGEIGSMVSYTNQKTIYIDPDVNQIDTLKQIKKGL